MNRRTCACGATIVCADLDGFTVWLDGEPAPNGMFSVQQHGDTLDAVADGTGPYRRHTCGHDAVYSRPDVADHIPRTHVANDRARDAAAAEAITAIRLMRAHGVALGPVESRVADVRVAHPDKSYTELAIITGMGRSAYSGAICQIKRRARRLNRQAA